MCLAAVHGVASLASLGVLFADVIDGRLSVLSLPSLAVLTTGVAVQWKVSRRLARLTLLNVMSNYADREAARSMRS